MALPTSTLILECIFKNCSSVKQVGYATKRVYLFHQNAVQVDSCAKKAPAPVTQTLSLEYPQNLARKGRFVWRELLTTLHLIGCRVLKWVHWLRSHVWKVISVPPIHLLPWAGGHAGRVITVLKTHRTPFKRHRDPFLVQTEVPLLEVCVFRAHIRLDQVRAGAFLWNSFCLAIILLHA